MRRRGTMLICDICHGSVFVKNLKGYGKSRWKHIDLCKYDICPGCVRVCQKRLKSDPQPENLDKLFAIIHSSRREIILS